MASTDLYIKQVWYRLSKGKPEPAAGLWRPAVESTLPAALQRLADRVAADEGLYSLLMYHYSLSLSALSEISFASINAAPSNHVLLVSSAARKRWRLVRASGADNPPSSLLLKYLPNRCDLDNPPPCQDFWFYTVGPGEEIDNGIIVRASDASVPGIVTLGLWANGVPDIDDPVFDGFADTNVGGGELFDNLIDIGCAIIMESADLREVIRQAEVATGVESSMAGVPG